MQGTLQKLEHYRSIGKSCYVSVLIFLDSRGKGSDHADNLEDEYDDGYESQDAAEEFGVEEEDQF